MLQNIINNFCTSAVTENYFHLNGNFVPFKYWSLNIWKTRIVIIINVYFCISIHTFVAFSQNKIASARKSNLMTTDQFINTSVSWAVRWSVLELFFKFLRGSYKNSLSHKKLTHKNFEASTLSSLASSRGLKVKKWAKKCYFSKTFNNIFKLFFLKRVNVKMLKKSWKIASKVLKWLNKVFSFIKFFKTLHIFKNICYLISISDKYMHFYAVT